MNLQGPALFRRFPAIAGALPWLALGTFPTPVEPLRMRGILASDGMWIKRDDLSGEPYGGNKVRKLEFLLAEARRQGVTRLITAGAAGSHHALATTVYGRALGFDVTLVLFPQPISDRVRSAVLQGHALGAELRWTERMELVPLALRVASRAHRAERCMVIAPGGSDPVGTLGYVSGGVELAEQIEAGALPVPCEVHVAAGTLGTAAGLAIGLGMAGLPCRIVATRVASLLVTNTLVLRGLVQRTVRRLRDAGLDLPDAGEWFRRIELRHDQIGPGYGLASPAGRAALEAAESAGLTLDPTYTGKAAAGFLAAMTGTGGARLFWHTLSASQPAVEADQAGLPAPVRRYLSSVH